MRALGELTGLPLHTCPGCRPEVFTNWCPGAAGAPDAVRRFGGRRLTVSMRLLALA